MEDTLTHVVDELTGLGYSEHFRVVDGRLHALGTGQRFEPTDVVILGYYRFEGVSDPDDMAIVYAIETKTGMRGVLVDAFGVYADPKIGAALHDVPMLGKIAA